ncbi:hypothetical protein L0Y69_00210 [bacterium]|nr:hypothetical protein [bacterium]
MNIDTIILRINEYIINPIIAFLFVLATLLFISGLVRFFLMGDSEGKNRETGKQHMVWGLVGMFIMVSVFGIMQLIVNTFGIDLSEFDAEIPS